MIDLNFILTYTIFHWPLTFDLPSYTHKTRILPRYNGSVRRPSCQLSFQNSVADSAVSLTFKTVYFILFFPFIRITYFFILQLFNLVSFFFRITIDLIKLFQPVNCDNRFLFFIFPLIMSLLFSFFLSFSVVTSCSWSNWSLVCLSEILRMDRYYFISSWLSYSALSSLRSLILFELFIESLLWFCYSSPRFWCSSLVRVSSALFQDMLIVIVWMIHFDRWLRNSWPLASYAWPWSWDFTFSYIAMLAALW